MPKLFLPIALMVLGTIKLPGEHDFSDAEAEHATEQLVRLGHGASAASQLHGTQATPAVPQPLAKVTPQDALETLAAFLSSGEISSDEVAQRLGFVIGMVVDDDELEQPELEAPTQPEPEGPAVPPPSPVEAEKPAETKKPADSQTELVIPPAVVKELVKAGFVITKPETIQAADDEALLAVKGMTPELLARVRQITE